MVDINYGTAPVPTYFLKYKRNKVNKYQVYKNTKNFRSLVAAATAAASAATAITVSFMWRNNCWVGNIKDGKRYLEAKIIRKCHFYRQGTNRTYKHFYSTVYV